NHSRKGKALPHIGRHSRKTRPLLRLVQLHLQCSTLRSKRHQHTEETTMLTRTVLSSAQSKSIPKIRDLGVMGLLLCLFPALLFGQATRKASGAKPTSPAGTMQHYNIKPSDLPAAKIENDVNNGPRVVPQPE